MHDTYNILKKTINWFRNKPGIWQWAEWLSYWGTESVCTTPRCLLSSWSRLEIKLHQFVPLHYKHIPDKEFLIKVAAVLMVNNSRHTQLEVCSQSRNISARGRQSFQHLEFVRNPAAVSTGCSKNYPGLINIRRETLFEECKHNIGYLHCSVSCNLKTTTHCGAKVFTFCVEKYFCIQKTVIVKMLEVSPFVV